jgi:hypothetical protein
MGCRGILVMCDVQLSVRPVRPVICIAYDSIVYLTNVSLGYSLANHRQKITNDLTCFIDTSERFVK